jgi:hypothetical protein
MTGMAPSGRIKEPIGVPNGRIALAKYRRLTWLSPLAPVLGVMLPLRLYSMYFY